MVRYMQKLNLTSEHRWCHTPKEIKFLPGNTIKYIFRRTPHLWQPGGCCFDFSPTLFSFTEASGMSGLT